MKFKNILAITFALVFVVAFIAPSISAWWIFGNNTGNAKAVVKAKDTNIGLPNTNDINNGIISDPMNDVNMGFCSGTQSLDTLFATHIHSCSTGSLQVLANDNLDLRSLSMTSLVGPSINIFALSGGQYGGSYNSQIALGSFGNPGMLLKADKDISIKSNGKIDLFGFPINLLSKEVNIGVSGESVTINGDLIKYLDLNGTGDAYACLHQDGTLYRKSTPCN